MMSECKQAQSHEQQIAELKDRRLPKTELECAAVREIKDLEQRLAEAEAKIPRWIPVSERLPKKDTPVLAIDGNGDMAVANLVQGEMWRAEAFGEWGYQNNSGWDRGPDAIYGDVVAWMELPEVYKPECPRPEAPKSGKGE